MDDAGTDATTSDAGGLCLGAFDAVTPDDQGDEAHPETTIKARQQRSTSRVGRKGFSIIMSMPTEDGPQHIDSLLAVQARSQQQSRESRRAAQKLGGQ